MSALSRLLIRLCRPTPESLAALRSLGNDAPEFMLWRALETPEVYAYVALPDSTQAAAHFEAQVRATLPDIAFCRQELLLHVVGASAGAPAPFHYVVETDVQPEAEPDFNAWYDGEHMPGLAAVTGTVRAMRLRNAEGSPRYHACYDLTRAETLGSAPWLAVRATPWSARIRPAFRNTKRTMFRQI